MTTRFAVSQKERGFTLVELAIVLIIIGLLIGGTLKGQELINGARVTATTAQIKALEAGTLTFQDTYNGFPGDLLNAGSRLPNCNANAHCALNIAGVTGDGRIDIAGPVPSAPTRALTVGAENFAYFNHLFNADLLDGVDGTATVNVGKGVLGAKLGSAKHFRIGYMSSGTEGIDGSNTDTLVSGASIRPGHYFYLTSFTPATAVTVVANVNNNSIAPSEAGRIDAKYDDGAPNTGNVLAVGVSVAANAVAANTCRAGGTPDNGKSADSVYGTANRQSDCGLYVRFSN